MCIVIVKLYELLRLFRPEQRVNLHIILPRGEIEQTKTVLEMQKEYAVARKHSILWQICIYNRKVTLVAPNIDRIEVWLEKDKIP